MGNLAMRCMIHAVPSVRVMRTDGKIVEYDEPVLASKVMKQHADHLVVHCAPAERKSGVPGQRRNKLTILRSDQMLELGQAYLLYPIPPQYRNSFMKSQCCTLSEDKEADSFEDDGGLVRGSFRGLAMRLKIHRKQLSMLTKGARKVGYTNEGADRLLTVSPPLPSFQTVESDSEDNSAVFDESGQRIRSASSEVIRRDHSPVLAYHITLLEHFERGEQEFGCG
ncbi:hypothetical protein R1sor_013046 [Riccia sorocarpa]|uniref:Uncharacterized protein n=1 Tax=Riccia sorocarpa TaxID=122646 RepID=A0ABD3H843_9MARC